MAGKEIKNNCTARTNNAAINLYEKERLPSLSWPLRQ